jgi:hypothetical protein
MSPLQRERPFSFFLCLSNIGWTHHGPNTNKGEAPWNCKSAKLVRIFSFKESTGCPFQKAKIKHLCQNKWRSRISLHKIGRFCSNSPIFQWKLGRFHDLCPIPSSLGRKIAQTRKSGKNRLVPVSISHSYQVSAPIGTIMRFKTWRTYVICVMWALWRGRNNRIFR